MQRPSAKTAGQLSWFFKATLCAHMLGCTLGGRTPRGNQAHGNLSRQVCSPRCAPEGVNADMSSGQGLLPQECAAGLLTGLEDYQQARYRRPGLSTNIARKFQIMQKDKRRGRALGKEGDGRVILPIVHFKTRRACRWISATLLNLVFHL